MDIRPIALIVDIVRSRELPDRQEAQARIEETFRTVEGVVAFARPLWPTVGDEFQAVLPHLSDALTATTMARLLLPEEIDCRFGLGAGEIHDVGKGVTGPIQDGSAWWCARDAIDEAHRREKAINPYLRSWFWSEDRSAEDGVVNSYLLMRDHLISAMKPRERRIAAAGLLGKPQAEIAEAEGITQSAVSQSLRRSGGAALLAGQHAMREPGRS
ncbi:SatD family protein [Georgenia yuyongxinii]